MTNPRRHQDWTVDRVVPLLGGAMILLSVALAVGLTPWWLILTGFVGANLVFYSAVGWCPASLLMERAGLPRANCRVRNATT
ncbi:YgaP family membrane protein [Rhodococcus triatomae]